MSIIDEQYKKFGKPCKWLDCDDMYHMTLCMKQRFMKDILHDRFKQLGLKYPDAAYWFIDDSCLHTGTHDYKCFDSADKSENLDWESHEEDIEYSDTEKEAIAIIEKKLEDDSYVRELYSKAKNFMISMKKQKLSEYIEELRKMEENENNY